MILNQRTVDDVDKVQLIAAMMATNTAEDRLPEGEISRVTGSETGEFFMVCEKALELIAVMHRETEEGFDGVLWFERLEESGRNSLADRLVEFLTDFAPEEEGLRSVVIEWLVGSCL